VRVNGGERRLSVWRLSLVRGTNCSGLGRDRVKGATTVWLMSSVGIAGPVVSSRCRCCLRSLVVLVS
jgi:hypothetical protein